MHTELCMRVLPSLLHFYYIIITYFSLTTVYLSIYLSLYPYVYISIYINLSIHSYNNKIKMRLLNIEFNSILKSTSTKQTELNSIFKRLTATFILKGHTGVNVWFVL